MTTPSAEHRHVSAVFTDVVRGVPADRWDDPSPVPDWRARDVVDHLVTWLAGFLESGAGVTLPSGPSVEEDPAGAWQVHCDAVQALLDDPGTPGRMLHNPHVGDVPLDEAIDRARDRTPSRRIFRPPSAARGGSSSRAAGLALQEGSRA